MLPARVDVLAGVASVIQLSPKSARQAVQSSLMRIFACDEMSVREMHELYHYSS
jgi:hypothetical protein